MTTSSSSRPVKLQRLAVKERRQLTLSSDYTFRGRMFPLLATELNRQQRKCQRFNLLTIEGWNSAQRRQHLSKDAWYRAYATYVSTYYVACKKSNSLCIIFCRSRNRTVRLGITVTVIVSVTVPTHSLSPSVVRIRTRYRCHGLSVPMVWVWNKVRLGQYTIWKRREHRLSV